MPVTNYICDPPPPDALYKVYMLSLSLWHRSKIDLGSMCTAVGTHWLRLRNSPPPPPHLGSNTRALLVSQDIRHLFVTPLVRTDPLSVHNFPRKPNKKSQDPEAYTKAPTSVSHDTSQNQKSSKLFRAVKFGRLFLFQNVLDPDPLDP
jgi:hypothetical protein